MKKICLVLVCLSFLSSLPSQAARLILNTNEDRIVYTRSTLPKKEKIVEVNNYANGVENKSVTKSNPKVNPEGYYVQENRTMRIQEHQMQMLGEDFRPELAGTRWAYDMYSEGPTQMSDNSKNYEEDDEQDEEMNDDLSDEDDEFVAENVEEKDPKDLSGFRALFDGRHSREAADYLYKDNENAPVIPSGFYE